MNKEIKNNKFNLLIIMETDKSLWKTIYKNNKKKEQQKVKIYNTILAKCEKKIQSTALGIREFLLCIPTHHQRIH